MPQFYYVTTKTKEEAKRIAKALLQKKYIAGANMFPLESLYWWQDKICEEEEYALVMQSTKDNFAKIEELVKTLHSYEIPCIVSFAITESSPDFLNWIRETAEHIDKKEE
jgi:periplasmic divalent cation tolerance protein